MEEENKLVEERRSKLNALREKGIAYPNDFRRKDLAGDLQEKYGARSKEELEPLKAEAAIAGRMVLKRVMGKASFATLQDGSGRSALTSRRMDCACTDSSPLLVLNSVPCTATMSPRSQCLKSS